MKLIVASAILTFACVEAWVLPPLSTDSSPSSSSSRLSSTNYKYGQGMMNNGDDGWGNSAVAERPFENLWNGNNQYQGDVGYNNVNYNSFSEQSNQYNRQYDGQYEANQEYNGQPYQGEYQNQEFNNGQSYGGDAQYEGGPDQGYYNNEQQFYPPPNNGYNEQPNGGYGGRPYPPPNQPGDYNRFEPNQNYGYREELPRGDERDPRDERYPARMNNGRLSRPRSSSPLSLLDEMFDDPFFDDPFFDNFFSMPTPFSMLSPFYRSRRRGSSSLMNSGFMSAFSMLDRMREKMEVFSRDNGGFLQRTEESNRILLSKAERYLNDDVACRMALGVGNEERIRLGPILGSASSMAYASVWDGQEQRQERRNQRNLQIAVDGPDPRMEAVVKLTAFDNDEIQSLVLQTRDGREISVPVIGRDNGENYNNGYNNYDDGRFFTENRGDAPPPGVIDAEVVEQGR